MRAKVVEEEEEDDCDDYEEDEERDFNREQAQELINLAKDVKKMGFTPLSRLMTSLVKQAYETEGKEDSLFSNEFVFEITRLWCACKFKKG